MRVAMIILGVILASAPIATAQMMMTGYGSGSFNSTPTVPCNSGQLDFSVSTGCNLVFAGH